MKLLQYSIGHDMHMVKFDSSYFQTYRFFDITKSNRMLADLLEEEKAMIDAEIQTI